MPAHDPHVGHAASSIRVRSSSLTEVSAAVVMVSIRCMPVLRAPSVRVVCPPSMGPPETNTVGMLHRNAAINMPGVILSQLEMHTSASARCASTMYSTESAMRSRDGSE